VTPSVQTPETVMVQAEPVALDQIVHNLLMNALQAVEKLPPGERWLTLTVSAHGARGQLDVADTGPGIAPEVLPRIFEPFYSTREGGLGLGLSLCETLATTMGGSLTATPNEPHGAVFALSLPLAGVTP
jgi:C4-dicarboxylate-specific signal transduction histidine kinase